jgi:hypothetical protein
VGGYETLQEPPYASVFEIYFVYFILFFIFYLHIYPFLKSLKIYAVQRASVVREILITELDYVRFLSVLVKVQSVPTCVCFIINLLVISGLLLPVAQSKHSVTRRNQRYFPASGDYKNIQHQVC